MTSPSQALGQVLDVADRLRGRPGRVVLHSGRAAEGLGRLSIVAADPRAVVVGVVGAVEVIERDGTVSARGTDAYRLIEQRLAQSPGARALGYLGYDIGAAASGIEPWPEGRGRDGREPDVWFGIYAAHWQLDHGSGEARIVGASGDAEILAEAIASGEAAPAAAPVIGPLAPGPGVDDAYARGFDAVATYLVDGDCYQVNLSRRLRAPISAPGDPLQLFARLCQRNPEPYAALIETGDHAIISGSPERFLYRDAGSSRLETRPIKGTRARTGDAALDAAARRALAASEKERAEHLMIVDLERNDLGRVATVGSVHVEALFEIVALPTLFHMVSTVACEIDDGVGLADILDATFPGGSITGAPKRRAMEIIRELEPVARGVYTGAIGMLGADGAIDLSIAIRTAVLCETSLTLHVGGGLVADSFLERELTETEEKAAGWRRALEPDRRDAPDDARRRARLEER